jgi:cell division protein FtsL
MRGRVIGIGVLLAAVLSTAVGVVFSTHQGRKLFVQLQSLKAEQDELDMEWGRLQLEQSTLGSHGRIETLARERLQMRHPATGSAVMVQP